MQAYSVHAYIVVKLKDDVLITEVHVCLQLRLEHAAAAAAEIN